MSRRKYKRLAWITFVFHLFWVIVLLGGIPLSHCLKWYMQYHMCAFTMTIVSQIIWFGCPLTMLETYLRRKADPHYGNYTGSFICLLLRKILGIRVPGWVVIPQIFLVGIISFIFYF